MLFNFYLYIYIYIIKKEEGKLHKKSRSLYHVHNKSRLFIFDD
jgi:hypothetical protein